MKNDILVEKLTFANEIINQEKEFEEKEWQMKYDLKVHKHPTLRKAHIPKSLKSFWEQKQSVPFFIT